MSLRVGVLTFHRSINFGSYWQARALVEGLARAGHEVELIDHESRAVSRAELRCAFQPLLPERSPRSDFPLYARKIRKLTTAVDRLPLSLALPLDAPRRPSPYDVVVIGSDEVWNFRHPWYGNRPLFFGEGLGGSRLVSYAASFGNHDAAEGLAPHWADRLRQFTSISVRDRNSRELVASVLDDNPELVLDPCLQFAEILPEPEPAGRDVIVYGHSFPAWFAELVRNWAARAGHRLVSLGYRNDWADHQAIAIGPEEFARRMSAARAVVTNFFHGCVFALAYRRPLAAVPSAYRRNKIAGLLDLLAARHALAEPDINAGDFANLLSTPPAAATQETLGRFRERSSRFLAQALAT